MTTTRKMTVSAESRMVRAISFGVFWRRAPSTRPIIRSRKLVPGSAVTRTLMRSDRTRVPPVTALRSPPASRMTGADSPVMADSSTMAAPSTISPSAGMISRAETTNRSPLRRRSAGTDSIEPSALRSRAVRLARVLRSSSAWAWPRPSAIASAKLANRTVNQSQRAIWSAKPAGSPFALASRPIVVSSAPTSVTKMTGFLSRWSGSSLRTAASAARPTRARSKRGWVSARMSFSRSIQDPRAGHEEMLDDGAEGQGG